jgi:hypothetical protein
MASPGLTYNNDIPITGGCCPRRLFNNHDNVMYLWLIFIMSIDAIGKETLAMAILRRNKKRRTPTIVWLL